MGDNTIKNPPNKATADRMYRAAVKNLRRAEILFYDAAFMYGFDHTEDAIHCARTQVATEQLLANCLGPIPEKAPSEERASR